MRWGREPSDCESKLEPSFQFKWFLAPNFQGPSMLMFLYRIPDAFKVSGVVTNLQDYFQKCPGKDLFIHLWHARIVFASFYLETTSRISKEESSTFERLSSSDSTTNPLFIPHKPGENTVCGGFQEFCHPG